MNYDFTGVIEDWFADSPVPNPEQIMLRNQIRDAFRYNPAAKRLLAKVADHCASENLNPVSGLALALSYGLAVGVELEKEKSSRGRAVC
jgi:hypothetical protein